MRGRPAQVRTLRVRGVGTDPASGRSSHWRSISLPASLGGRFDRLAVNNHMKRERPQPRLLLSTREAATALGINVRHFKRHSQAHVRRVRSGQFTLYPLRDLERWVEDKATITGRAQRR